MKFKKKYKDLKTLKEYSWLLTDKMNDPHELSKISVEASSDYAFCSEEIYNIKIHKAKFWPTIKLKTNNSGKLEYRDKPLSDTLTEETWRATDLGQEELFLKYRLKALEKIISSCKTFIYNQEKNYSNV